MIQDICIAATAIGCAWAWAWWAVNEAREQTKRDLASEETQREAIRDKRRPVGKPGKGE